MAQLAFDPTLGEYANDEPIGGTGYEIAEQPFQPGFSYMGPASGEANARAIYEAPVGPLDYSGNAYAHQAALKFQAEQSRAQAERDIEKSYEDALTRGHLEATRAAEEHLRTRNIRQAIEEGKSPFEALTMYGLAGRGSSNSMRGLVPQQPKSYEVEGGVVERGPNGEWVEVYRAPKPQRQEPITMVTEKIPAVEGVPAIPADSGKRSFAGIDWMRRDVPPTPAVPEVLAQPERTVRRPVMPSQSAPSGPAKKAVGGYKVGARYKGGLIYLGGDPKDPNSWDHGK